MGLALVGPIVGEVASVPSGSGATLADTGLGYDISIGGLGFKLKIGDDNPYERATAQFRKDQFDSSNNVGDQSLLGYWTEGQLSFHKGAGVKFYDASDPTVVNRYYTGDGVKPFTPGEVTLQADWGTATTGTFTGNTFGGSGNGFLALLDSGVLKYATSLTGATTSYVPTAGTVTNATTGPLCAYVTTTSNKIERVGIGTGAPASGAIYTHTAGFNGIFYAKDRLWAVDVNGVWYQLAPNPTAPPVAIGAGDKVFTAGDGWDTKWCLVDTPGVVLIANGGRIYAVTPDSSTGAVPSMSAPVQAAELPTGEAIRSMAYHLGFLILGTSAGIRVAVVDSQGQVTYGPLLVEWTATSVVTIARRGSSAFVGGGSTPALYEVNLAQQVGEGLEFGWTKHANPFTGTPTAYGTFTWAGSTLVAWQSAAAKYETGNLTPSGTLQTGLHRFGTLEPKQFQSVKVRIGGSAGTVNVSKVLADGSVISLLTLDVTTSTGEEITLGMTGPLEMAGLQFTLARSGTDATKGPTLYGYQLRALPAPKRQRLIRLPLMLMDVERRGVTRANGYEGSAWDRLSALEDMEQSGGVFQFQDFRTGEAGTVYIESIEHRGLTPPGKQSTGFGGVVFLTLRKL
jgi:hypothetical protein